MPSVRDLREQKGLSQQELASKAHVSTRTIARMEAGEETLKSTVALVAMALGVAPDEVQANIVNRVSRGKGQ